LASTEARVDFDLVVVGAGINGAAIARELALQGISMLVLEREDLASGTSSASSRLIHGGLRYLEHGAFGLVRESLREREILLETAPHRVKPLALELPIYASGRRARWQLDVGLWLYDHLFPSRILPRHRRRSALDVERALPGIRRDGLRGGLCYFDAQLEFPERLIVELLVDAAAHGAVISTHSEVAAIGADGDALAVSWRDATGGARRTRARVVVNAAGPWLDRVLPRGESARLIGGAKGSHLVLRPFPGAPTRAIYSEAVSDGRPYFVIPWNGLLLIGTTEERYDDAPEHAAASNAECAYLLAEAAHLFPAAGPLGNYLCYTQTGVRALPHAPGARLAAVTRRHAIYPHARVRGLYSVVGGKLTTHRALAEDMLASLVGPLGLNRARSLTRARALPGAFDGADQDELSAELAAALGPAAAPRLLRLYGSRSAEVLAAIRDRRELAAPVVGSSLLVAELVHGIEREWAVTLVDLLQRRCMVGLDASFGLTTAPGAVDALRRLGIWDDLRAEAELAEYRAFAARHRAVALGTCA
jgi:glycerol-3-phosphate dehydrogenase